MLAKEPIERIEPADPIEAIDPTEPIDRIDPVELIDKMDPVEFRDHNELDRTESMEDILSPRRPDVTRDQAAAVTMGWPAGERTYQSPPALVRACPVAMPGARSGGHR